MTHTGQTESAATDGENLHLIATHIRALDDGVLNRNSPAGRLALYCRWVCAGGCVIESGQQITSMRFNRAQRALVALMLRQALAGRPVRVTVLKSRKVGVSTLVQTLFVFLTEHFAHQTAIVLAHLPQSTNEIFKIAKRCSTHWQAQGEIYAKRIEQRSLDSNYWCHTAGSGSVVVGGTPNMLHLSEVALWRINKTDTYATSVRAVPFEPGTIIVEESTARGKEEFFTKWSAAADPRHPYAALFIPWFFDERFTVSRPLIGGPTAEERSLIASARRCGIELSEGALQWRRMAVDDIGPELFRREYPASPEEAVRAAEGLVVPDLRSCVVPDDREPKSCDRRVGGIDFGYNDPTVIVTGKACGRTIWVTGFYRQSSLLADDHVRALVSGHTYYCDPSGLQERREMIAAASRLRINTELVCAPTKWEAEGGWSSLRRLIVRGELKILESCAEQLIVEADSLTYDRNTGRIDKRRLPSCGHFDSLDALRYAITGALNLAGRIPTVIAV